LRKKWLTLILVISMIIALIPLQQTNAAEPTISVKLVNYFGNRTEANFTLTANYSVENTDVILTSNVPYKVKVVAGALALYNGDTVVYGPVSNFSIIPQQYNLDSLTIFNLGTNSIIGNRYFGKMEFTVENGVYVRPINLDLPFEDYLKGVVPREMPASWNLEALKSQAVAARTYSIRSVGKVVVDTQSFQVFGGLWDTTWPNSAKAVDDTAGQVLRYNGSLISAVYSSSNGGYTESAENEWGNSYKYLIAKEDSIDPKNPWSFKINKVQIDMGGKDLANPDQWWSNVKEVDTSITNYMKSWLNSHGYANKELKIIAIPELSVTGTKTSSGRYKTGYIKIEFFVKDKADNTYLMENGQIKRMVFEGQQSISTLRAMMGGSIFKSSLVDKVQTSGNVRLAGQDRFETAVKVSQQGWTSADTVILAVSNNFADALTATPLAAKKNAPILLTTTTQLTGTTKAEMQRLNAKNVIIIGGSGVISDSIVQELKVIGMNVTRIGGATRYETAAGVAREIGPNAEGIAVIVNGTNYPDALSVAPWAAKNGYPIIPVLKDSIPSKISETLNYLNTKKTIVIGGAGVLGDGMVAHLPSPWRIAGKDRFATSAEIIRKLNTSVDTAYLATGYGFADALTGSVLAGKSSGGLLLTAKDTLPTDIRDIISEKGLKNFLVLGGTGVVSNQVTSRLPNEAVEVFGRGYGHGVGMSQYGANSRAAKGQTYTQILQFYYPGTTLGN